MIHDIFLHTFKYAQGEKAAIHEMQRMMQTADED